jgi:hypothetical protein
MFAPPVVKSPTTEFPLSPPILMTRSTVREAIDFQGVIEGCPDHQWLLTDAIYDTTETLASSSTPRWVVLSQVTDPASSKSSTHENYYEARDRKDGWTLSAFSVLALAERIRRHRSKRSRPEA